MASPARCEACVRQGQLCFNAQQSEAPLFASYLSCAKHMPNMRCNKGDRRSRRKRRETAQRKIWATTLDPCREGERVCVPAPPGGGGGGGQHSQGLYITWLWAEAVAAEKAAKAALSASAASMASSGGRSASGSSPSSALLTSYSRNSLPCSHFCHMIITAACSTVAAACKKSGVESFSQNATQRQCKTPTRKMHLTALHSPKSCIVIRASLMHH